MHPRLNPSLTSASANLPLMRPMLSPLSAEVWLQDLFSSKAVARGEVIRRKRRDIETYAGMDAFVAELRRRGFRAVENSGQVVLFCNQAPVRRIL